MQSFDMAERSARASEAQTPPPQAHSASPQPTSAQQSTWNGFFSKGLALFSPSTDETPTQATPNTTTAPQPSTVPRPLPTHPLHPTPTPTPTSGALVVKRSPLPPRAPSPQAPQLPQAPQHRPQSRPRPARPPIAAQLAQKGPLSGYLYKYGSNVHKWKRRFFVLQPTTILYYYLSSGDMEPAGAVNLELFDRVEPVSWPTEEDYDTIGSPHDRARHRYSIRLRHREGNQELYLQASGEPERRRWIDALSSERVVALKGTIDRLTRVNEEQADAMQQLQEELHHARTSLVATREALATERRERQALVQRLGALNDQLIQHHHQHHAQDDLDHDPQMQAQPRMQVRAQWGHQQIQPSSLAQGEHTTALVLPPSEQGPHHPLQPQSQTVQRHVPLFDDADDTAATPPRPRAVPFGSSQSRAAASFMHVFDDDDDDDDGIMSGGGGVAARGLEEREGESAPSATTTTLERRDMAMIDNIRRLSMGHSTKAAVTMEELQGSRQAVRDLQTKLSKLAQHARALDRKNGELAVKAARSVQQTESLRKQKRVLIRELRKLRDDHKALQQAIKSNPALAVQRAQRTMSGDEDREEQGVEHSDGPQQREEGLPHDGGGGEPKGLVSNEDTEQQQQQQQHVAVAVAAMAEAVASEQEPPLPDVGSSSNSTSNGGGSVGAAYDPAVFRHSLRESIRRAITVSRQHTPALGDEVQSLSTMPAATPTATAPVGSKEATSPVPVTSVLGIADKFISPAELQQHQLQQLQQQEAQHQLQPSQHLPQKEQGGTSSGTGGATASSGSLFGDLFGVNFGSATTSTAPSTSASGNTTTTTTTATETSERERCILESGQFEYRVSYRGGVCVRLRPRVSSPQTDHVMACGCVFTALERIRCTGSGMVFVRTQDPPGWVFERSQGGIQVLEKAGMHKVEASVMVDEDDSRGGESKERTQSEDSVSEDETSTETRSVASETGSVDNNTSSGSSNALLALGGASGSDDLRDKLGNIVVEGQRSRSPSRSASVEDFLSLRETEDAVRDGEGGPSSEREGTAEEDSAAAAAAAGSTSFEVVFHSRKIGIQFRQTEGKILVSKLEVVCFGGSQHQRLPRIGAQLVGCNGKDVEDAPWSAVADMLKTTARPLRLRFREG